MKPATATVTFPYGARYSSGGIHKGVDLGTPHGTPLVAPVPGRVWYAGVGGGWGLAYGGQVIIETTVLPGGRRWVLLAHMSRVDVAAGQTVSAGQRVGLSGGTPGTTGAGTSTGAHVHVQLNRSTRWDDHINPAPALTYEGGFTVSARTEQQIADIHAFLGAGNGTRFPAKLGTDIVQTRKAVGSCQTALEELKRRTADIERMLGAANATKVVKRNDQTLGADIREIRAILTDLAVQVEALATT